MDFNGEVLARKRKKLRLSLASVASQLTLSHEQISSIEKNLMRGFVTPYFKKLAMLIHDFLGYNSMVISSNDILIR